MPTGQTIGRRDAESQTRPAAAVRRAGLIHPLARQSLSEYLVRLAGQHHAPVEALQVRPGPTRAIVYDPESLASAFGQALDPEALNGLVMIAGASDTGKSTLARLLCARLAAAGRHVAFLDGDPGQSSLGPPTTLSLAMGLPGQDDFPPRGPILRRFVESVSPRGHYLPLLASAVQLVEAARAAGAQTILYDTTGLVSREHGGLALKAAKIEILRPSTLIVLQERDELEPLLGLFQRRSRPQLLRLQPAAAAQRREPEERRAYRAQQFAAYFAAARPVALELRHFLVWPRCAFVLHQLVALENGDGLALGLGIVLAADLSTRRLVLLTPMTTMSGVRTLHLGDLIVDAQTFRDQALPTR